MVEGEDFSKFGVESTGIKNRLTDVLTGTEASVKNMGNLNLHAARTKINMYF